MRLWRLSQNEGHTLLSEHVDQILEDIGAWVREAAGARWVNKEKKIITREAARDWWLQRITAIVEGAVRPSGGRLNEKMEAVGLPDDVVKMAMELRRRYSAAIKTSTYMSPSTRDRLLDLVRSRISTLRSQYVGGTLDIEPVAFHALCSQEMDALNEERPAGSDDQSAFLKGCMYDIADRCLLRFSRRSQ